MIVACVYKSGGDYDAEYVRALKEGVWRYSSISFDFVCLTDRPEQVASFSQTIELKHNLPGWWSKIELFRPGLFGSEKIVYFDLDVMPLKELSAFFQVACSREPKMLRSRDAVGEKNDWPSSSIMSWTGDEMSLVYSKFITDGNVIQRASNNIARAGQRTDQGFIRTVINPKKFQDYLPKNYIVFKIDYLHNPYLFQEAHILNWTGKPRFQRMSMTLDHIRKIWKGRI